MSITLSVQTEVELRRLLHTGRWQSESEIICHGLELVKMEVEMEYLNPPPLPPGTLERIYRAESAAEQELASIPTHMKAANIFGSGFIQR